VNKQETKSVSQEAYAYTPGLKVKYSTAVSKTRRLPISGEVHVKVGDKVNYDTVVARAHVRGDPEVVNISGLLDVEPVDITNYLTKKIGDRICNGELLAAYSSLFGLIKKNVTSPLDGTLETISNMTGNIIIIRDPVPVQIDAYMPGTVTQVLPNEGAIVETNAALIQGIFGVGGETHGKIRTLVDSPDRELTPDLITADSSGSVVIGGSLVTLDAFKKAVELGVSCIVSGGVLYEDMTRFMGEEIGVAITGQEELGLTIIITEGFGKMRMSQRIFDLFKHFEGHMASVNGATQIRAGVLRPEIVIPHDQEIRPSSKSGLETGIVPGTPIRIIREPYFGAIGKVVDLPVELRKVESGSFVRILNAKIEDDKVVAVPRANVEIIEE